MSGIEKKDPLSFDEMETVCQEPIPTIAIDGYWGVTVKQHIVKINLAEERYDSASNTVRKHVVARLIMPIDSFEGVVNGLSNLLANLTQEQKPS